jgi:hypothetical protein
MFLEEVVSVELTADELALLARALAEYRSRSTANGLVVDHIDSLTEKLSSTLDE